MPIGSFRSRVGWEMRMRLEVTNGEKIADKWYVFPEGMGDDIP